MTAGGIVFVTSELDPIVPGGAGAVIAGLVRRLQGSGTSVVLAAPRRPHPDLTEGVTWVDVPDPDGTVEWFLERSRLAALALADRLAGGDRPEMIEFHDFEALGWWALAHRSDLGLEEVRIAIRIHGPVEAITASVGSRPHPLDVVSELELQVFSMADAVITPSEPLSRWVTHRYDLEASRVVVSPPPVRRVSRREWRPDADPSFVFYGRLAETKGPQDLIAAALPVLDGHQGVTLQLIGPDGWALESKRPMSEVLEESIPERHRDRIRLAGRMDRHLAFDQMATAWAVVFPSRFESFCLACHEARRAGVPVIVPDLPAFEEFGTSTGALKYDGSIGGLTTVLDDVAWDRSLVDPLSERPPPPVGDPVAMYEGPLPALRHLTSQSALSIAALHHLERAVGAETGQGRGLAQGFLRYVPRPMARMAALVLPGKVKDRLRHRASWWEEEARREAEARRLEVEAGINAGSFPELDRPRTSVVIPCYNHGEWVEAAVISVFEQTDSSWEIVLVDDGSTDPGTVAEVQRLAAWPRVRLIQQANAGLPAARNAGMSAARGEFLVPLDADDEIAPEYLERMHAALDSEPDAAYAHCWARYTGNMNAYWITRPFNAYQILLSNSVLGCALIRAAAWRAAGGYDASMVGGNEDWDLWLRLMEAGWGEVEVRQPLFLYRMHGESMSVDTLARFETARLGLRDRHPDLYAVETAAASKATWYPWVTVLRRARRRVTLDQDITDVEEAAILVRPDSVPEALHATRGKVVVEWDLLSDPPPHALWMIAQGLEENPVAAKAVAHGVPVAWRRWALHDPDALLDGAIEVDLEVKHDAEPRLHQGIAPVSDWMAPDALPEPDLRVIRQRPEEEGPLPAWLGG